MSFKYKFEDKSMNPEIDPGSAEAVGQRTRSYCLGVNYGYLLASRGGDPAKCPPINHTTCGKSVNSFESGVRAAYAAAYLERQQKIEEQEPHRADPGN